LRLSVNIDQYGEMQGCCSAEQRFYTNVLRERSERKMDVLMVEKTPILKRFLRCLYW
jgi:hypothetical protein